VSDIVAIIPARSQSKGVPNKNVLPLNGIPLIGYSIQAALLSKNIDRVIVSTDSAEYADVAKKYGAEVPFLRPEKYSRDDSNDIEFLIHLLEWFGLEDQRKPELLVHLRPTTPLRNPRVIDDAINLFLDNNYSSLRSCHEMTQSSYKTFEIENELLKCLCNEDGFNIEKTNKHRQSYTPTYDANGYVDILRSKLILEEGLMHGDKVHGFKTNQMFEIDNINDLEFLEYIISKKPELFNTLFNK
jgi:CMP-N,N'-diacetyllegionaminic acid synthase